jgi:hypothetical protein
MSFKSLRPAFAAGVAAAALSFAGPAFAWQDFFRIQMRPYAFNYDCFYAYPSAVNPNVYCPPYGYWGHPEGWPYYGTGREKRD